MAKKACKNCRRIIEKGKVCPNCKDSELTNNWKGYVVILDPEKSEIAERLGIDKPGKYALRIGK